MYVVVCCLFDIHTALIVGPFVYVLKYILMQSTCLLIFAVKKGKNKCPLILRESGLSVNAHPGVIFSHRSHMLTYAPFSNY